MQRKFAIYAWIVLAWNLAVILWGAYVRATGSGAGCGSHWPLCNGVVIPQAPQVHTAIEFTHRMMSGLALLLVLGLLLWGRSLYRRGQPTWLGIHLSAAFILVEALLGAGLVLFELTAQNQSAARAVAVAIHLANTFVLVGCLALTAWWASGRPAVRLKEQRVLPWLLAGLLGMILIGMSGAVTALGDTLFPVSSLSEGLLADADPSAHFLVRLRVYHPLIAIAVAVYSLYVGRALFVRTSGFSRRLLMIVFGLGLLQLTAGLTNVLLLAPIPMQMIHLLLADLVWIAYLLTAAELLAARSTLSAEAS